MNSLVLNKCGFVVERFPTFTALVTVYFSMNFMMCAQFRWVAEGLPILFTQTGRSSSVDFNLRNKNWFLLKAFPPVEHL